MHADEQISPAKAKLIELQNNLKAEALRDHDVEAAPCPLMFEPSVRRVMKVSRDYINYAVSEGRMVAPAQEEPRAWSSEEFWSWWWSSRQKHRELLDVERQGNVPAAHKSGVNYRKLAQRMIERRAAMHGCTLSHTMTVSFKDQRSSALTEDQITRWNDQHEADVLKAIKNLPRQVFRAVLGPAISTVPNDLFLFVIAPERLTKSGFPALWHLHIDLFLRPLEGRLFERNLSTVKARVEKAFSELSTDLDAEAHLQKVDDGFRGYSCKHAEDNIALYHSNFL